MLHSPDTCQDIDCSRCQFLVDSGVIYGCDYCGKTLFEKNSDHTYDEKLGAHKCNDCSDKEKRDLLNKCYNQLLAEYLSTPEEHKIIFLQLLETLEGKVILSGEIGGNELADLRRNIISRFDLDLDSKILEESLRKLVEVFDIKPPPSAKIIFKNNTSMTFTPTTGVKTGIA